MAKTIARPATYEDLLKVPDHLVAEIVDGELFASPRQARPHTRAVTALSARLFTMFDDGDGGPGRWWILFEPELHLGDDVLVPDLAGWRRARLPESSSTPWISVVPDWVCEVLSPTTGKLDRALKMPAYARHGVPYAWLVDPLQRTLEVFRLEQHRWVLISSYGDDDVVNAEPFEEVAIELRHLWLPTPPPPQS